MLLPLVRGFCPRTNPLDGSAIRRRHLGQSPGRTGGSGAEPPNQRRGTGPAALLYVVVAVALPVHASAIESAGPRSHKAFRTAAPPVLDGRLEDPCWQETAAGTGFVTPQAGTPVACQTTFRVVYDAQNLYFGVRARDPDARKVKSRHIEHDGPLWGDDCIEIFLEPEQRGMEYVQVIANCRGAVWDGYATQMGISMDSSFETGATAAARIEDDCWSVEVAIPLAGLNLRPGAGARWGMNVAREKKTDPAKLSCWVRTGASKFGIPGKFGVLELAGIDAAPFAWEISPCRFVEPEFLAGGEVAGVLECAVRSLGKSPGKVTVEATLVDAGGRHVASSVGVAVASGSETSLRIPSSVASPGSCRVLLRVRDAASRKLLHVSAQQIDIQCAPIELTLLAPWYRDSIFASCPIDSIEAQATVHGEEGEVRLTAVLIGGGKALATRDLVGRAGEPIKFQFPARDLAVGEYVVCVSRPDREGTSAQRTVHVLPPVEGEACLDRKGRLLIDGKPFFAWGFMGASPDERMTKAGFNTIHTYIAYYIHRDRDMPGWLDKCHSLGLKVVMYPYPGEIGLHICRDKKRFKDRTMERIADLVRLYKHHPAVLGWYLCDEPRGIVHRKEMERVRDVVAKEDPHHPCVVLDNSGRGVAGLGRAGEILWVDPYPGFAKDGPPRMPLATVSIAMDDMIDGTRDLLRHYWIAPQAFDWGGWGGEKAKTERAPTYDEERAMTYLGIIHGAQGVVYFAWKYALKEPHLADGFLNQLGPEIRTLMPVLVDGVDVEGVSIDVTPADHRIHVRALRVGGHVTIMAVNPEPKGARANINVPGLGSRHLRVASEARAIASTDGAFGDDFAPFATHVYTTRPDE